MSAPLVTRRLLAALAVLAVGAAACGTETPEGRAAAKVDQFPEDLLDGPFLNLTVQREDIGGSLETQTGNTYLEGVGLFSLREGDLLQATLQVSKLADAARPEDPEFQRQVANQVGGTKVQSFVMGDRSVYRTSQRKQSITSWFDGDYFLILAVRDTYPTPRALLRELLTEIDL